MYTFKTVNVSFRVYRTYSINSWNFSNTIYIYILNVKNLRYMDNLAIIFQVLIMFRIMRFYPVFTKAKLLETIVTEIAFAKLGQNLHC